MPQTCRNPAGANGWASGDTYSNHLSSRNSVSLKNNQPAIPYDGDLVSLGAISDVVCSLCGPGCRSPKNRKRPTLRIWQSNDGFVTYYCARCGIRGWARNGNEAQGWLRTAGTAGPGTISPAQPDAAQQARIESALRIWQESVPLTGTLGQRYFGERRRLPIGTLDLNPCLRFHHGEVAVIGLMVDPITGEACGVHRTFLNRDGTKRDRKMLGRMGCIRLSPEPVAKSLGLVEGVEDGLALLLAGRSPIWTATCAGAIERFPVINIDELDVYGDNDDVGEAAAERLAVRYELGGKRVRLHWPPDQFKDWDEALAEGGAA